MAYFVTKNQFLNKYRNQLQKWVIAIGLLMVAAVAIWYFRDINALKWQHINKLGIRLPLRYDTHGIDVSKHNGRIDWQKVRAMRFEGLRLQFAFIKATEGTSITDKAFKTNWQQADDVGLYRGAYHFYIPWRTAKPQFDNFVKSVSLKKGDLPPVLDFEIGTKSLSQQQVIQNVKEWLQMAEAYYGVRPIIYTNADFYRRYVKDNLDDYPLWIADYSNFDLDRYDKKANIIIWQHSKSGYVEGINGVVDYNVLLGNADDLKELCLQ